MGRLKGAMSQKTDPEISPLPLEHPCASCDVRPASFCRRLDGDTLLDMRAIGKQMSLMPSQPLFFEGDLVERVFMVASGALKLYALLGDGRRQVTGFMFPGDFLGISMNEEHAFSAEALGAVSLHAFSRKQFGELCKRYPAIEHELFHLAADELAAAQQQMVLLGRKNAAERLASLILNLACRKERLTRSEESIVDLPMSRIDIADYLGLTKETVSRMIAQLRNDKLIRLANQDRIEIIDRERLSDLAAGFGNC